jgi:hypothetical protein
MSSRLRASGPRCSPTQLSQLATYQIALKVLADFERRQENLERAAGLIDIYHSPDSTKQQFGIEADDAHSHWVNLRQLSESE